MTKPAYNERIQWSPNAHNRGGRPKLAAIHTQEGNGTAASLANYLCNPNSGVSYHYTVDNDRNVVAVVNTDMSSWSVGNANNVVCPNICFAGSFVGWSRDEWLLNMGNGIEIAAYLAVVDCKKYGIDPRVVGWDDIKAGKTGITDHRGVNMGYLRSPGHTDVGDNFPWDVFAAHVDRFANEGTSTLPEKTAIEVAREANEWLGDKVTESREETTPDGKGKFVHYQNGSVYWSPKTGPDAYAVPLDIRAKWESMGWERGILGYPAKPKLDLVEFTKSNGNVVAGGTVQAFEGGTVYARKDSTAWHVRGLVKEHYGRLRYETGDLGWPTSDEISWGNSTHGGTYQTFEHGTIWWITQGNSTLALDSAGNPLIVPEENPKPPESADLTGKILIDYSAGVPAAADVKAAGYVGAIRYVSDPRSTWMLGKPLKTKETEDFKAQELILASVYQYAKQDWEVPSDGPGDARRGLQLHKAAGGLDTAPIYAAIDASPSRQEYEQKVRPYLQGWLKELPNSRLGVYCNGRVIDWLVADGIGAYYWQHNFSSLDGKNYKNPDGETNGHHPAAHLHQIRIDKDKVGSLGIDINVILKRDFGGW